MQTIKSTFASNDKHSNSAYTIWLPDGEVRAIIQISHGMCEHMGRYEKFAQTFTSKGFAVCGNDHIGHGHTVPNPDELGNMPRGSADILVDDLKRMSDLVRDRIPGKPLFLLGHSMGSFIARLYLTRYGRELSGALILGTGGPENPTWLAKLIASACSIGNGGRARPKLLLFAAFGSYNDRFESGDTSAFAWLSRNTDNVAEYEHDKLCSSFIFTANGFHTLFDLLDRVSKKSWASELPKDLPILLASGEDDPVGNYGRGVLEVYRRIMAADVHDVTLMLYPLFRHEILNELGRERVYTDIESWLERHM